MEKEAISEHDLVKTLKNQSKLIEQLRKKVFILQEAIIKSNTLPSCNINDSLSEISPIVSRYFPQSTKTVIAFGGMSLSLGMPPAEFLRTFTAKAANTIFVKDFRQCWYQQGLLGQSHNIKTTVEALKKTIHDNQEHIYTIGTSAVGYAAILFGVLLNANKIIAFGPQTLVTRKTFNRYKGIDSNLADIDFEGQYLDLKKVIEGTDFSGEIHIHYAEENRNDKMAAEHLQSIPNIHLHPWPTKTHGIAGWLKSQNKLNAVFEDI